MILIKTEWKLGTASIILADLFLKQIQSSLMSKMSRVVSYFTS